MTSSYQKISGFDRPHVSEMLSDSKISTLESGLKNFRICLRIRRMRVDDSRIRKEKVADSKISGYVWTGPQLITLQPLIGGVCFKRFLSQSLLIEDNHQSNPEMIFNKKISRFRLTTQNWYAIFSPSRQITWWVSDFYRPSIN